MRHQLFGIFLLAISLFSCSPSYAGQGVHITTSTNNVATTFSAAFPQLALTLVNPTTKHAFIANGCASPIAVSFTNYTAAVAPSSSTTTNPQQYFIPASSSAPLPYMGCGKYVWIRSDSGTACSSGDIIINCY
jgi:hypothetical protein